MGNRHRTAWFVVDDLAGAVEVAAAHSDLLVVDMENTLVGYGSTPDERRDALGRAIEIVAGSGRIRRLAFVSNARFDMPALEHSDLAVRTVTAARKPYVRLRPLRDLRAELEGAAVYGDQPLTDGMLARNLDGIWLQPRHAHEPAAVEPLWPRLMRRTGRPFIDRRFALQP